LLTIPESLMINLCVCSNYFYALIYPFSQNYADNIICHVFIENHFK